jgi:tRNA(adenine34) deaminase
VTKASLQSVTLSPDQIRLGIDSAFQVAMAATARGEVPVGASVWHPDRGVIASASNRVEELNDATAHAEVLAIRAASSTLGSWRLNDCALFVTLEPCTMCIGAIRNARVGALVFGAADPRAGAAGSLFDLALDERLGSTPRVIANVDAERCAELLSEFFRSLRHS